jgi:hypothetical protein
LLKKPRRRWGKDCAVNPPSASKRLLEGAKSREFFRIGGLRFFRNSSTGLIEWHRGGYERRHASVFYMV